MADVKVLYETLDNRLVAVLMIERDPKEAWEEKEIKIRTYLGQVFQKQPWYGEDRRFVDWMLWENHYFIYTANPDMEIGFERVCKKQKIKTEKNFGFFFRWTVQSLLYHAQKKQSSLISEDTQTYHGI